MKAVWLCLLVVLLPLSAHAANEDLKGKAEAAWKERGSPEKAMLAVQLYQKIVDSDRSDVQSRIKLARATYWAIEEIVVTSDKSLKIAMYERAIAACNQVIDMDEENVGAWYWLVWDMGALTLVKGAFSGWNLREAIVGTIMVSKKDDAYEYGGIYRYWARVIYETPSLMGKFLHFTDEDSVSLYKKAISIEPRYLRTHIFLADSYEKMGKKQEAKKEYQYCIDTADDALPGMAPETVLYKKVAGERLAKMR